MHIKELKKAAPLLQKIEALDKDIVKIDWYANQIKDKHLEIQLDLSHERPDADKVTFDEDGSIVSFQNDFIQFFNPLSRFAPQTGGRIIRETKNNCKMQISEIVALQVLGVMVAHKEAERMAIINQLTSMGFEINI